MDFARERIHDLWAEITPLLAEHYAEIAHYQDIALDPDRAAYEAAEAAGLLRCYTLRDDAKLVGYAVYFVKPSLHYRGSLQAAQDVLFIRLDNRGSTGMRFIRWCDEQLAAEHVQVVYQHVKARHDFGRMLGRLGYELIDLVYARRLDVWPQ